MKKPLLAAALIAALPTLLFAESDVDWGGFYAGLQLGNTEVSNDAVGDDSDGSMGFHAGYLHQTRGSYVFGGELSYDASAEFDVLGSVQKVDTTRLLFKGGHSFGRTLVYGIVGYSHLDATNADEDGYSAGVGVSYMVNDKISLGAEYIRDNYDDQGEDFEADSVSVRASYRF